MCVLELGMGMEMVGYGVVNIWDEGGRYVKSGFDFLISLGFGASILIQL